VNISEEAKEKLSFIVLEVEKEDENLVALNLDNQSAN